MLLVYVIKLLQIHKIICKMLFNNNNKKYINNNKNFEQ